MKNFSTKHTIIALLAMTLGLTSCTDNGDNDAPDTSAIEKTTVNLGLGLAAAPASSKTGKTVQRGEIPVAIKDIVVTATKVWNGRDASLGFNYVATETFNLLSWWDDYTRYQTTTSKFTLDNVAIGTNDFKVVTTPNTSGWHGFSGLVDDGSLINWNGRNYTALEWGLKGNKDQVPYAIYTGELNGVVISKDAPETNRLNFNLSTQYGRIIAAFTLDRELGQAYIVRIIGTGYASSTSTTPLFSAEEHDLTGAGGKNITVQKWSDETSIAGGVIKYRIEIREKGQHDWETAPLYSYSFTGETIEASVSKTVHYTIGKANVLTNLDGEDNIKFTVQPWDEQETVNVSK
jgi:hypothetical protein